MRRIWLAAIVVSIGCASAPIRKQDQVALGNADALVRQGCYDCLLEARAIYERIAVGRSRPLVITRLFETELLIAVRERELALDATKTFERARSLIPSLPAGSEPERYIGIAEAIPPDVEGSPRVELGTFQREHLEFGRNAAPTLEWLQTGVLSETVRLYLSLAVDCAYPPDRRQAPGPPRRVVQAPVDAPPLLRFRTSICRQFNRHALEQIRIDVPRFVETSYFLARLVVAEAVARNTGPANGRELLTEAHARFAQSPSVTYLFGRFHQVIGDCRAALGYYDATIALKAPHEDAHLGRTMCLTFLKRSDEAIDAATVIIDRRFDTIALGFYWRAWNRHVRKELDLARADITRAKALRSRADIFLLAGIIEYDQKDLMPARTDLAAALEMEPASCPASWYLGLVHMDLKKFPESASFFEAAMHCYETRVLMSEQSLKDMQAREGLDAEFKARQIAGFEAAIKEDRSQQYASAFNAANHYAQAGNLEKARPLLELASRDSALADLVAQLRKIIGGGF